VLLTNGPLVGELAQRAGDVRRADKAQQGIEHHDGCLQDPLIVKSLLLKQPERIEALGLGLWLGLRLGRLGESTLRVPVETTGNPLTGGAKQATPQPTAFMRLTTGAGGTVRKVGGQRQRAHPLSPVHQPSLLALRIPATDCTAPQSGSRDDESTRRRQQAPGGQRRMGQAAGTRPWRGEASGTPAAYARRPRAASPGIPPTGVMTS
jgi:hypothetical protein